MSVLNSIKFNKAFTLTVVVSIFLYIIFAYDLERTEYTKLMFLYALLFAVFYKLLNFSKLEFKLLAITSILFRVVFLFAIPNLSQDFYRFIWDGRMLLEGINPYLYTPESFISKEIFPIAQAQELYNGMQSLNASHFTNYPPINQLCFFIAALFSAKSILGSVFVLRSIIILADIGTLYFGKKLLEKLNIPVKRIFWYVLNPFIIIELTGNLHFEGVMIFFLVWSLYLLHKRKWQWAAVVLALSISTKLIPLMFLPLFYQWFVKRESSYKKLILFYGIVGITTLALFLPFYSSEFIHNYSKTVGLWFQNFEFNASLYYLAREIGYWLTGYNEIAIIGKVIPVIVLLAVLMITFLRKNKTTISLIAAMLLALSFYFFTATTVHPWYIATPLILSVFTNYKFPLVWSFVIVLSYLAYASNNNTENLWVITLEYLIVYGVFVKELWFKRNIEQR